MSLEEDFEEAKEQEEGEEEYEVRQEPDSIRRLGAALIGFIGIMVIGLCLVVSGAIWTGFVHARRPSFAAPPPAGTLEHTLIEATRRAHDLDRKKGEELTRWGWVDRSKGVARIPIDRAIDVVIEEAR